MCARTRDTAGMSAWMPSRKKDGWGASKQTLAIGNSARAACCKNHCCQKLPRSMYSLYPGPVSEMRTWGGDAASAHACMRGIPAVGAGRCMADAHGRLGSKRGAPEGHD